MAELNTRKDDAIAWYLKCAEDEIWNDDAVTCKFPVLLYMKWPGTLVYVLDALAAPGTLCNATELMLSPRCVEGLDGPERICKRVVGYITNQ